VLTFHDLAPSPNNTKVRMALRYKGIEFEAIPADPFDRSAIVELTGQELTPVIADKGIVLNDSEAILQYLDANYRDTPRLYPALREGRRRCDEWARALDRRLGKPWMGVFFGAIGMRDTIDADARQAFADELRALDAEIGDRAPDEDAPICDLRVAQWATYAFPGDAFAKRVPLVTKVSDAFALATSDYPNVVRLIGPWAERLG